MHEQILNNNNFILKYFRPKYLTRMYIVDLTKPSEHAIARINRSAGRSGSTSLALKAVTFI